MHTGKRNSLQIPVEGQFDRLSTQLISGKLFQTKKTPFSASKSSKRFATNVCEAHLNTKMDYSFINVL